MMVKVPSVSRPTIHMYTFGRDKGGGKEGTWAMIATASTSPLRVVLSADSHNLSLKEMVCFRPYQVENVPNAIQNALLNQS